MIDTVVSPTLRDAGAGIDIMLHDRLIVGNGEVFSFRRAGTLMTSEQLARPLLAREA
ncbi:JAB domain-containing protein [Falsiroseomonas sp. HW251]|uniref:JAB domain-containing protein n=1 Tax=Falsiroseomonas sp. HW251 TaxID=3390998 RepID=UPI003D314F37